MSDERQGVSRLNALKREVLAMDLSEQNRWAVGRAIQHVRDGELSTKALKRMLRQVKENHDALAARDR